MIQELQALLWVPWEKGGGGAEGGNLLEALPAKQEPQTSSALTHIVVVISRYVCWIIHERIADIEGQNSQGGVAR